MALRPISARAVPIWMTAESRESFLRKSANCCEASFVFVDLLNFVSFKLNAFMTFFLEEKSADGVAYNKCHHSKSKFNPFITDY